MSQQDTQERRNRRSAHQLTAMSYLAESVAVIADTDGFVFASSDATNATVLGAFAPRIANATTPSVRQSLFNELACHVTGASSRNISVRRVDVFGAEDLLIAHGGKLSGRDQGLGRAIPAILRIQRDHIPTA